MSDECAKEISMVIWDHHLCWNLHIYPHWRFRYKPPKRLSYYGPRTWMNFILNRYNEYPFFLRNFPRELSEVF